MVSASAVTPSKSQQIFIMYILAREFVQFPVNKNKYNCINYFQANWKQTSYNKPQIRKWPELQST